MRIIVDAFGGDNAPEQILLGCAQARQELGVDILLTGDKARLEACAKELNLQQELAAMEILPCGQTLTMEDEPTSVIREKSDSSMAVGLRDPRTGHRPWAVLQLRTENKERTLYNLVGFQTNLKFGEQKRVFGMIPGLAQAEFVRYGVMHRNTFLNSPGLLSGDYSFRGRPELFFAGQITGVEGYMESASSGILAGINLARKLLGKAPLLLPETTMMGALARYISGYEGKDFQPMGANFGVLPPLPEKIRDKRQRYMALAQRGLADLERTCKELDEPLEESALGAEERESV